MITLEEKRELLEEMKRELNIAKKVHIEVCREGVSLPVYANIGDAGMDIRAAEDTKLVPGETKVIPTGLKVAIPEGYELQVRPRSGLSLKTPLRIANAPGTIDSGYRGEIGVIISNMTPISADYCSTYSVDETGGKPGIYEIKKGDRIAQIVLCRYETMEFEVVEEGRVQTLGLNRGGGFGSTGIH